MLRLWGSERSKRSMFYTGKSTGYREFAVYRKTHRSNDTLGRTNVFNEARPRTKEYWVRRSAVNEYRVSIHHAPTGVA